MFGISGNVDVSSAIMGRLRLEFAIIALCIPLEWQSIMLVFGGWFLDTIKLASGKYDW